MTVVIQTLDLTKRYRVKRLRRITAVDGISFQVERGQVFGFLGPNGSGKTTTIGMLLGIITPTAGQVRLLGRGGPAGLHEARQRVGATLETPNFYPYLSGRDNLRLVANVKGVGRTDVDRVLEMVGLAGRKKDPFEKYSLGMKQRLALAATMLGDPDVVILDEPANGLDPEGMKEIREIILGLAAQGKTIFLSSHLLSEVEKTCTHVAIIKEGRLIRQASVEEIVHTGVLLNLRAPDPAALLREVAGFPGAREAWADDPDVVVELDEDRPQDLNRWLGERGIHLMHLSHRRRSLEDVFIELTGDTAPGAMEPAVQQGDADA